MYDAQREFLSFEVCTPSSMPRLLSSTHVGARPKTRLLQVHQTSLAEPPPVSEKHGLVKMRCQGASRCSASHGGDLTLGWETSDFCIRYVWKVRGQEPVEGRYRKAGKLLALLAPSCCSVCTIQLYCAPLRRESSLEEWLAARQPRRPPATRAGVTKWLISSTHQRLDVAIEREAVSARIHCPTPPFDLLSACLSLATLIRHHEGADDRINPKKLGKSVFSGPLTTRDLEHGNGLEAPDGQDSANSVASGDALRRVVALPHWLDGPPSDRRDLRKKLTGSETRPALPSNPAVESASRGR